ncbi:MAG TPA: hypothetical protein PKW95_06320 [bacterium]|nr:hypothetical protein [bacterium]
MRDLLIAFLVVSILAVFGCDNDDDDDNDDSNDDDNDTGDDDSADDDEFPEINENWTYEIIDDWADDFAMVIDNNGVVYVVYYDNAPIDSNKHNTLFLASYLSGAWKSEILMEDVGDWVYLDTKIALALDSESALHTIFPVYLDENNNGELIHGIYKNGTFQTSTITDFDGKFPGPSMVIGNDDTLYISYFNNSKFYFATYLNEEWNFEEIEEINNPTFNFTPRSFLKIDPDENILLVYTRADDEEGYEETLIKRREGEMWMLEQCVDSALAPSFAVDHNGYYHLIYLKYLSTSELYYATNVCCDWSYEYIINEYINWQHQLDVDNEQRAHIIISGDSLSQMKAGDYYLYNNNGDWVSESIGCGPNNITSFNIDADNDTLHLVLNAGSYLVHLTREIELE